MTWDYGADGRKVKYEGLSDTREYTDGIEYVNEEIFIYHPEGGVYRDTSIEYPAECLHSDPGRIGKEALFRMIKV